MASSAFLLVPLWPFLNLYLNLNLNLPFKPRSGAATA